MALPLSAFVFPDDIEGPMSPQTLWPKINQLITSAYAPMSARSSVALGRGSSGRLYAGVNVELPGLPHHQSIHAAQFLVANLTLNNESELNCLAISTDGRNFHAPCGHCCQFLKEVRNASDTQVLITDPTGQEGTYMDLRTFLPQGFPPYNCVPLNDRVPHLLDPSDTRLTDMDLFVARHSNAYFDSGCELQRRALMAAKRSFAPYSWCQSGVALMDHDGEIYNGWYIESEAGSPSLGPVQVALVDFVAKGGGHEFDKIVEAVLVEKKDPIVSQEATARMILGKIAHDCVVSVLRWHCS